jgi:hypothetical protein
MGDVSMQAPIRSSHGCWDLPDLSQKPLHTVTKKTEIAGNHPVRLLRLGIHLRI